MPEDCDLTPESRQLALSFAARATALAHVVAENDAVDVALSANLLFWTVALENLLKEGVANGVATGPHKVVPVTPEPESVSV